MRLGEVCFQMIRMRKDGQPRIAMAWEREERNLAIRNSLDGVPSDDEPRGPQRRRRRGVCAFVKRRDGVSEVKRAGGCR